MSRDEGFRILADENIERATVTYLRKLGHDVDWVRDVPELGSVVTIPRLPSTRFRNAGSSSPKTTISLPN